VRTIAILPFELARQAVETQQAVEDAANGFGQLIRTEIQLTANTTDQQVSLVYNGDHWQLEIREDS
jgi:hypothetical protein